MVTKQESNIESYINQYLKLWDFFGVIQVRKDGNIIFEKSCGYACLEFGIKNTMSTRFSLASLSKQFTAFAIMMLHDKKMIDVDNSANTYLPSCLKIQDSITVHHLLSHTSGLYNFYNFDNDFFGYENRLTYSQNEFFNNYINKKPIKEPGFNFDYNNSNYNLLAWIIENVSGMKYANFLSKFIFNPLVMKNSFLDNGDTLIYDKAFNYLRNFDDYIERPYYNEKFSIGAGAIVSTCDDLYKWYQCLRDKKILSIETYERFFTENLSHYCYGLEHYNIYNTEKYSHGGDNLAISTYMQSFFDEDICIIILSNNESVDQYSLGNCISDILHNVEVDIPSEHKELSLTENELKRYCGIYLKGKVEIELINGKLYFVRFNNSLNIELYPTGQNQLSRRFFDQKNPYTFSFDNQGLPYFFGYKKCN